MELVPHTQFTTDSVPKQHRFDVYRDSMSVLFQVDRERQLREQDFEAHLEIFMFDQVMLMHAQSDEASYQRDPKDILADGMEMIMLQLYIKGDAEFKSGKNATYLQTGDIVVVDLNQEAHFYITAFEKISVLFPRELIDEYIPSASLWHGKTLPRNRPMTNLLKSHMWSLYELGPNITMASCADLQRSLLNLTSSALQSSSDNLARSAEIIAATQLQEIKKYIRHHLANPSLSPDTIASAFGLSRAHLYRLAEPLSGITNHIRNQRLKRCWKELQNPGNNHLTITELGFKWGYNDAGTFTRNFKKAFGMLPKDARALGKLNKAHPPLFEEGENPSRNYESWIRSLAD